MSRRYSLPKERELARRLREEAVEARPEFSPELHVRLWHALRGHVATPPVSASLPRKRFWTAAALAAVAASIVCAAMIGWRLRDVALRPQSVAGGAANADIDVVAGLADHVSTRIDMLLSSTVTSQRWAYLDHDARLAVQFLADRFPSDPTRLQTAEEQP